MSNEIIVRQEQEDFMPVLSVQQAGQRYQAIRQFIGAQMAPGRDYGRIPGTEKDTLLKPGAEKLCTLFGLSAGFALVERIEDWSGDQHDGEPFFYDLYRCTLHRGDRLIATGDGSCNSFESKYRWRNAKQTCPHCGASAIIKGKEEYGGGWLCFKKQGGCGAKFGDNDPAITGQQTGKVPNPDIADQVNTIQKMAQKRALIAATLIGVNASDYFTQDMEDFHTGAYVDAEYTVSEEPQSKGKSAPKQQAKPASRPQQAKQQPEEDREDVREIDAIIVSAAIGKEGSYFYVLVDEEDIPEPIQIPIPEREPTPGDRIYIKKAMRQWSGKRWQYVCDSAVTIMPVSEGATEEASAEPVE